MPGSNSLRNLLADLVNPEEQNQENPAFFFMDESDFEVLRVDRGQVRVLTPNEAGTIRVRRPCRLPAPPRIQLLLKKAYEFQEQLNQRPELTQRDLANEAGMHPSRVTHILNLLKLAPAIQRYVMSMEPTTRRSKLNERGLRLLTGVPQAEQLQTYQNLIS